MNLTIRGQTASLEEWADHSPLEPLEIHLRISAGMPVEQAVFSEKNEDQYRPPNDNPRKKHSRFIGVTWKTQKKRWYARIRHDGEDYGLGFFKEEMAAAIAYNEAARELRGADAIFNEL